MGSEMCIRDSASGHPAADELLTMYRWVQPDVLIPVHGEQQHMLANAKLAKEAGIPRQINGENGDLFIISPNKAIRRAALPVGRLSLQGRKLVPVAALATGGPAS